MLWLKKSLQQMVKEMYIDTHSYDTTFRGVCDYLNIGMVAMIRFLDDCTRECVHQKCTDEDLFFERAEALIKKSNRQKVLDQILFYHLTRRLNSEPSLSSRNLFECITGDGPLATFFRSYGIEFKEVGGCLRLFRNEKLVQLSKTCHLMGRLGDVSDAPDFCVNGFMFKEHLEADSYRGTLQNAPEFISDVADALKEPNIVTDYASQSTYYCYEYRLPLKMVIFDDNQELKQSKKASHFLKEVLYYLFCHYKESTQLMGGFHGHYLRIDDKANIPENFFVKGEKIF